MTITPVDLSKQKILVTGPTSQVARPLIEMLVKQSDEIYGLARFSKPSDEEAIRQLGAKTIKKDLASDRLDDIPDDFDYVLHFAVVKTGNFDYDMQANAHGAGRLLAHCKNARAFLLCSSGGVYQYAGHEPLPENAPLGDNHRSLMPTYSICKIAQETVVKFAGEQFGVPTVTGRLSMPYGDNGGWPFYHLLMMKQGIPIDIHPEQPNLYSPLHAIDYCKQVPYLLAAASLEGNTFNWGGKETVAIEEWCEYLSELTGFEPVYKLTDKAFGSLCQNTEKLQSIYQGEQVHWKDGIRSMVRTLLPDLLKPEYR